jgi:hypothetical protein
MVISVHLPKTAGKSFEAALLAHFGAALREDYSTFPMNTPVEQRRRAALEGCLANGMEDFHGVRCIHGHFLPLRYLLLADRRPVTFVTWLRHPVQRAISNYHYWRRAFDPATAPPLHRRVVEEDWSLERFCLCDEMRDMYSEFLWGFPIENFAFIGITEHFESDLAEFADRYLGIAVTPERLNAATAPGEVHAVDLGLQRRVETFHERDMALYERALALRQTRVARR